MARGRRSATDVTILLDRLDARHTSGLDANGRRWGVRGAPVGASVEVRRGRKSTARRMRLVAPAPDAVTPPCPAFGICGGCQLQEMSLDRQRAEKALLLRRLVGLDDENGQPVDNQVVVHPVRGARRAYAYRNKLELSWAPHRYVPEGVDRDTVVAEGSFLGFHPPGWFSKVVPLDGCHLGTPAMNAVVKSISDMNLAPAWDTRLHTGVWRHLVVRDGGTVDEPQVLVTLVTTSGADADVLATIGAEVGALPGVVGVLHVVNDGVAEVARGELRAVLSGRDWLDVRLGAAHLRLPYDAFFQVNPEGAAILVDTIAEALGLDNGPPTLLADLYCGVGAIGLALSNRVSQVLGIEVHEEAIVRARENAARMGVSGEWHAGLVEDVLPTVGDISGARILVDPPRAGLHPRAARFLAQQVAEVLVYVACGPASLGRDRDILEAGGWQMTDLWAVDLFPQTHHIEAVARFVRKPCRD